MRTQQFAVYEKEPAHGKDKNGVILAPFDTKEEAEQAGLRWGYYGDNYYVDSYIIEYNSIMTRDELIVKQQLQIEEYRQMLMENSKIIKTMKGRFYNIGQPLNDNNLQFNKEQMVWCFKVAELVEQLNYIE